MRFENEIEIGVGIYTIRELSRILRIPYAKLSRWINRYWDGELGREFEQCYSWKTGKSKAVGFHTLVEFYIFYCLSEAGVKTRAVLNAHKELSQIFETPHPFAHREVTHNIKTDGTRIYLKAKDKIITLDGTKQLNLQFLKIFFKNLEFNIENIVVRFWPLGKKGSIVVDPKRKFGHPVLENSNVYPETIYNLYKGRETKEYIAFLYGLTLKQVEDSIEYCKAA